MLQGTVNAASVVSHIGAQSGLLHTSEIPEWLSRAKAAKVKVKII